MRVTTLRRYPVKSMLGEDVAALAVDERGAAGDRELALIDVANGRVATAKHPRLWRSLLRCAASGEPGQVRIALPDGRSVRVADGADDVLTELLGRPVRLSGERPAGASVERPAPEDVLERGVDASVDFATLEIGQGSPGRSFVDYAPLHLVTTATLRRLGVEAVRYRPNLVVATPPGFPPFTENEWAGRELSAGDGAGGAVRLRGLIPTPRCAVPTLEHGELPRAPDAVRRPVTENRVDVPGFGRLPCVGVYLEVLEAGTIRVDDQLSID